VTLRAWRDVGQSTPALRLPAQGDGGGERVSVLLGREPATPHQHASAACCPARAGLRDIVVRDARGMEHVHPSGRRRAGDSARRAARREALDREYRISRRRTVSTSPPKASATDRARQAQAPVAGRVTTVTAPAAWQVASLAPAVSECSAREGRDASPHLVISGRHSSRPPRWHSARYGSEHDDDRDRAARERSRRHEAGWFSPFSGHRRSAHAARGRGGRPVDGVPEGLAGGEGLRQGAA